MKIRVKIPEEFVGNKDKVNTFVDDVLLWGLETEMDIIFYNWYHPKDRTRNDKRLWAVFSVEADYSYMFSLKWGATLHKKQQRDL